MEIANYAIANKIDTEPAFEWWSKDLLHKQRRLIKLSQKRSIQTGLKFGLPLPLTVAEALEIDRRNNNSLWHENNSL